MKIAFISQSNPFTDKTAWSGTIFKLRESIEKAGFEVVWWHCSANKNWEKHFATLFRKIFHYNLWNVTSFYFRKLAKSVDKNLLHSDDIGYIFLPLHTQMAQYLDTKIPIIGHGDATFKLMEEYYWKGVPYLISRNGNRCEKNGLKACDIVIRASNWAAESVKEFYGVEASKVKVLELGANFDHPGVIKWVPYNEGGRLNVIFSGVDWDRKGGCLAVNTVQKLREMGLDAVLFVMGTKEMPEEFKKCEFIEHLGFLNKNIPEQYEKYIEVFSRGHIFLLPTRAECAGVVFCEASGFGIPSFTYDTGGVPNYVENGVNGYRLPMEAGHLEFAEKIFETISSGELEKLHLGSLKKYDDSLSWDVWSRKFKKFIE